MSFCLIEKRITNGNVDNKAENSRHENILANEKALRLCDSYSFLYDIMLQLTDK